MTDPMADLDLASDPDVYVPSHDSWLLARHAAAGAGQMVVEVGCGAGAASIVAAASGARVVATDLNPAAVVLARENAGRNGVRIQALRCDLWAGVRVGCVTRLLINPPYLPTQEGERVRGPLNLAFDAGADGRRFLRRLAAQLAADRPRWPSGFEALVVVSSLQSLVWATRCLEDAGYRVKELDSVHVDFERLVLFRLVPKSSNHGP